MHRQVYKILLHVRRYVRLYSIMFAQTSRNNVIYVYIIMVYFLKVN